MAGYELDESIAEDDFRVIARERLARQDQDFQERWWPVINDEDPHGRMMGYTVVWTAMVVHETWQRKAKGEQVTEYYSRDDLPEPDDDETALPSPFKDIKAYDEVRRKQQIDEQ